MAGRRAGIFISYIGDPASAVSATRAIRGELDQLDRAAGTSASKWNSSTARMSRSLDDFSKKASGIGSKLTKSVTLPIAVGFGLAFKEANDAQKILKQTEAVIKSTGGAANVTAGHVEKLAGKLASKVGIDDELIQSGANVLLTFKDIRNEAGKGNNIFDQTVRITNDMSVALGQDLKSSSIQVGKALNDPIKGITALTRVGVTFSDEQKNQIKWLTATGDKMGAQKIILRELTSEFGGSAKAQATDGDKAKVAMGDMAEEIGASLLPAVKSISTWVRRLGRGFRNLPEGAQTAVVAFLALAATSGPVVKGIAAIAGALSFLLAHPIVLIIALIVAFIAAIALVAIKWREVVDWIKNNSLLAVLLAIFVPVLSWIAAVGIAIGFLSEHWRTAWEAIQNAARWAWENYIRPAWEAMQTAATVLWENFLRPVFSAIADFITLILIPAVQTWWNVNLEIWSFIATLITDIWNSWILPIWNAIYAFLAFTLGPAFTAFQTVVQTVWGVIGGAISGAWELIRPIFETVWGWLVTTLPEAWNGLSGVVSSVWGTITGTISGAARTIGDVVAGILNGVAGVASAVGLDDVAEKLRDWAGKAGNWGESRPTGTPGSIGTFAAGGLANGAGRFNRPTFLVGEGNPNYPEFVIATDPKHRRRNQGLVSMLADQVGGCAGCAGAFQTGGIPIIPDVPILTTGGAPSPSVIEEFTSKFRGAWRVVTEGGGGAVGDVMRGAFNWIRDKAIGKLADKAKQLLEFFKKMNPFGGGGGSFFGGPAPTGACRDWLSEGYKLKRGTAPSEAELGCMFKRAMQESGCNPNAINNWDSNAAAGYPSEGLLQTIPQTFRGHAVPGCGDIRNPICNAAAATGYAYGRYGNWCVVAAKPGGYRAGGIPRIPTFDSGGTLVPGINIVRNATGSPERLQPADRPTIHIEHLEINAGPGVDGAQLFDEFMAEAERRAFLEIGSVR